MQKVIELCIPFLHMKHVRPMVERVKHQQQQQQLSNYFNFCTSCVSDISAETRNISNAVLCSELVSEDNGSKKGTCSSVCVALCNKAKDTTE